MSVSKQKNFHVPLSNDTYLALRAAAHVTGRPATQIARNLIESWLKERKKELLNQELAAYVQENAGSRFDIDPELEAAGIEHLIKKKGRLK
jgi:hypothetical protein